jgi:hypothetical protein
LDLTQGTSRSICSCSHLFIILTRSVSDTEEAPAQTSSAHAKTANKEFHNVILAAKDKGHNAKGKGKDHAATPTAEVEVGSDARCVMFYVLILTFIQHLN